MGAWGVFSSQVYVEFVDERDLHRPDQCSLRASRAPIPRTESWHRLCIHPTAVRKTPATKVVAQGEKAHA